jgi:hypothetical protein
MTLPEFREWQKCVPIPSGGCHAFRPIKNLDQVWAYATGEADISDLPPTSGCGPGGCTMGRDRAESWIRQIGLIANFNPAATRGITQSCRMFNTMLAARDEDFNYLQSNKKTSYVCFDDSGFLVLQYNNPDDYLWEKNGRRQGVMILTLFDKQGIKEGGDDIRSTIEWATSSEAFLPYSEKNYPWEPEDASISPTEIKIRVTCDHGFDCENGDKWIESVNVRRSTRIFEHYVEEHAPGGKAIQQGTSTGFCSVYPKP